MTENVVREREEEVQFLDTNFLTIKNKEERKRKENKEEFINFLTLKNKEEMKRKENKEEMINFLTIKDKDEKKRKVNKEELVNFLTIKDKEEIKRKENKEELIPPNGGWGWLVVLGSLTILTLTSALVPAYGLIFSPLFNEHHTSSSTVSWIFNMNQFIWNITGIFVGPLSDHFGMRKVSFIGGVLVSTSIMSSSYVSKPEYLFIVFSLITGFGQGLSMMVSLIIVPNYFDKRKGLSIGLTMCGICAGHFVGPFLVSFLLDHFGFRGMTFILGAILLHICCASMVFHPVEWHSRKQTMKNAINCYEKKLWKEILDNKYYLVATETLRKTSTIDLHDKMDLDKNIEFHDNHSCSLSCLNNYSYSGKEIPANETLEYGTQFTENIAKPKSCMSTLIFIFHSVYENLLLWLKMHRIKIITVATSLIIASYTNYIMMVPFAMTEAGYTLHEISMTLTAAGISNTVSRFIITFMTDLLPFSTKYYFMAASLLLLISMYALTFASKLEYIIFFLCVFGSSAGTCISLVSLVILEFMGLKYIPRVLGLNSFLVSILFLLIGPIIGVIRDVTGSFSFCFRILGIGPLVAFGLWFFMPFAILSDRKKNGQINSSSNELKLDEMKS